MNPNSPRLRELRTKAINKTLTLEDMREAVALMREGRISASIVSAKSKAKKAPVDTQALLGELFPGGE